MKRYYYITIVLCLLFSLKGYAQEPVIFKGENIVIGQHVSVLEDATNNLTINDVQNSSGFETSKIQIPNFQLSNSDFWLKFSVKNLSDQNHIILELEYPLLSTCEFYSPANGKYTVNKLSYSTAFSQRKYKHQNFLFDIDLLTGSTATYYLKVKSSEPMVLPLILGTYQSITESLWTNDLVWGLFLGLLLVMVLYNLFIYFSTKDIAYLYYVVYSLFIGLTQATLGGYTYRYLLANYPGLNHLGIIVFPGLAGIAGNLFMMSFLQTKENVPKLHKIIYAVIFVYTLAIIFRVLGFDQVSYRTMDVSSLCTVVVTFIVTITLSRRGYRPAKLFLLAFSIFFVGLLLFVLRNLGILPYNNFTNYTQEGGTALDVVLLAIALADKINMFKREKEKSQEETLKALQENARIVREQNVILEAKVEERTVELKASNTELEKTLVDLKETESQLVESEKMASLGQLTAGIAHEINNPINFITSNVSPLQRDVSILLEAINKIENVSLSDGGSADKQKQIDDYKEEIDFDYLKIEINHLLKGINDGASRTAEIVKGLRIFSRLDEDDLKKADINEGLDSTLIIVNNLFNNKIKLVKEFGNIPLIECYPGKLNQAFLNIISNAVYAINKQHGENPDGVITIATSHDENNIYVKIKDNGTGMDDNTRKKIFEPFFTTKDVGEGTGLGMSITYNTIKKHNGQILIDSTVGVGTEFTLELPIIHNVTPVQ